MELHKKSKSRNLSVYEFFQILQVEWLMADLRTRLYPKKKDKEYWGKVREGKRQVIDNIAEKNQLPTIFTDDDMKRSFESKIYNPSGLPTFAYKNEENRKAQEPLDLLYYYHKGADVRFEWYNEIKVGKVKSYLPYGETVTVEHEGKDVVLPCSQVTRIL